MVGVSRDMQIGVVAVNIIVNPRAVVKVGVLRIIVRLFSLFLKKIHVVTLH